MPLAEFTDLRHHHFERRWLWELVPISAVLADQLTGARVDHQM
jgi:hypothetical protein